MSKILTVLPPVLTEYNEQLDKNEIRRPEHGMLDQFRSDTNSSTGILTNSEKEAFEKAPVGRTVEVPVMAYDSGNYTLTASKPTTFTPGFQERTSAKVGVTWVDHTFAIVMNKGEFVNNRINYQHHLRRELHAWDLALADAYNSMALAAVDSAKTQVLADSYGNTFASNVVNFAKAKEKIYLADLSQMVKSNRYYQPATIVGNGGVALLHDYLKVEGKYNSFNYEVNGSMFNMRRDQSIANAAAKFGTGYAMIDGNTAMLHQVGDLHRQGHVTTSGKEFGMTTLPISGAQLGVVYHSDGNIAGADNVTNKSNVPLDVRETWVFWSRTAVLTAYNSDQATNASPFIKYDVADS